MYCSNCGKEIPNTSKYCEVCGDNIDKNKIEVTSNTSEQTTNTNNINVKSNLSSNMSKKSKIITVIVITIIAIIIGQDFYVKKTRSYTITMSDIERMISSQYINNVTYIDKNYKSIEDGYGRKICVFTYQGYDYTLDNPYYTKTITFMVMKKNDIVTYSRCPDIYVANSVYKNDEDFKLKNNWGQVERLGLSRYYSKSFTSRY